ncbi:hypothetical protein [Costertonia aggregata]|uniref:Uncharacterized protein n=1 Tax=Costertonia aggregata TaxID=343403 RepID=A0A7H9ATH4_9FLAO|nr:hypothetical protein [Costertonia aggregata]QLG46781.1 hypothetical protein HYG79_15955 [Costertonia aggregata]
MDKNIVEKYQNLLNRHSHLRYAKECLEVLMKEVIIHEDTVVNKSVLKENYYHRSKIQKDVTKVPAIEGMAFLLEETESIVSHTIRVINIIGKSETFMLHVDDDANNLIAILKNSTMNLSKKYKQIEDYKNNSIVLSMNLHIYKKGKFFDFIKNNRGL